jgi:hypothetical protein
MKYLVVSILMGLLSVMAVIPAFGDTGSGVSIPLTTNVIDVLQVYDSPTGQPLANAYIFSGISIGLGQSVVKSLWVKNNSLTTDYVVTPVFTCNPAGYVGCAALSSQTVAKGAMVKFDFTMTGMAKGSPTVTLSFQRNQ